MAEENAFRLDSDSSPDFGRHVEVWRPEKNPVWSSNGVEWGGSEGTSFKYYEHNVGNLSLEVVGKNWLGEVFSLCLEDWEVGRVALSCHLSKDLLCQEMRNACKGSSESLGSPRSLCSECQERRRRCSDA